MRTEKAKNERNWGREYCHNTGQFNLDQRKIKHLTVEQRTGQGVVKRK